MMTFDEHCAMGHRVVDPRSIYGFVKRTEVRVSDVVIELAFIGSILDGFNLSNDVMVAFRNGLARQIKHNYEVCQRAD